VDAARIASVQVLVPAGVVPAVCEPLAGKRTPHSDYDAKFSLPYGVASGLLRGRLGLKELEPAAFTDPAALALMQRVSYAVDEASTFPRHYTGEVRVTFDDGRTLSHREPINRGHAERPLSNDEVREKYFANATLHFPQAHAAQVCDAVLALDRAPDLNGLEALLARDPSTH
jgi:2-methylcitrate dehydratase PrpD